MLLLLIAVLTVGGGVAVSQLPAVLAGAMLHPARTTVYRPMPTACIEQELTGEQVSLQGWRCAAAGERRGTVIYLHGIADNRSSAAGVITRFTAEGFDVVAYDSRGHGASGGDACTYGYFEHLDLWHVMDGLEPGPVILMGTSLGAAVALQAAAGRPGVAGVVAAEVFSDLRTIARERAPRLVPGWILARALRLAEQRGQFKVDEVSPANAAKAIRVPVLLIHGADDSDTVPDHSRRVLAALPGPKRLIIVPGARHNQSLAGPDVWGEIDRWLLTVAEAPSAVAGEWQALLNALKEKGIDLRPVEHRSNVIERTFSVGPDHDRQYQVGFTRLPQPLTPMEVVMRYPIAIPNVEHGRWVLWRVGGPGGNASAEYVAVWDRVQAALKDTPL